MPLFFIGYFIMPKRTAKNVWLLIASLFFYAWGEPIYVALMVVSIAANWLFGLAVGKPSRSRMMRFWLIAAIVFNVAVIGFFKYESFLAANTNTLLNASVIPDLHLPLPIGISFYTLQALSYVIDVYRGEAEAQHNPLFLGMYIACFPQLIAGPIVRYQTIQDQVINRKESLADVADGLRLFVVGLSKKALLANTCAILADKMLVMGGSQIGAIGAWSGLIAYTFQIIGQKHLAPTVASLIMSLESVFATLAGWIILKEYLSTQELIGCGLVFAAVILTQLPIPAKSSKN